MRLFAACACLLAAFFIVACVWEPSDTNSNSFAYDLQGTWVSNDPSIYSGTLVIDNNRITITGYSESQTPSGGNDDSRPFKNFTKGAALKGYSEEAPSGEVPPEEGTYKVGHIFIQDAGILQSGIPYTYWDDSPPPDYRKIKFLRFTFGDRVETLQNQ